MSGFKTVSQRSTSDISSTLHFTNLADFKYVQIASTLLDGCLTEFAILKSSFPVSMCS